jgi:hypothetical protein
VAAGYFLLRPSLRLIAGAAMMRLINVDTLQLEEFFGDDIPPYAILSHTWGNPKEELSYEDINTSPVPQKAGFQKIGSLCRQTANDGLSWAWCDTCCINKSSSSELSEAINSMFKWYENAAVCYAYLSDVPAVQSNEQRVKKFRESRWFTRGWTLQELLAPHHVEFYIQDWQFFGTKDDLSSLLKEITGINAGALSWPWAIPNYCVANKMSWASRRVTTRLEDRAYCMLGILGVHIPLLCGEGRNAFRRLQEELLKSSDDESVFAHSGPNILAEGPEAFDLGFNVTSLPRATIWEHSDIPSMESAASLYHPFTVTNMGINIRLRLFSKNLKHGPTSKIYGVLNCRDAVEYKYCLAVPLQATIMPYVYTRAPGDLHKVTEDEALDTDPRTIYIRQQEPPISHITCFLKTTLAQQYGLEVRSDTARFTYTAGFRRVILYLNPRAPRDLQELQYIFQAKSEKRSFIVTLVFDLVERRGRVSILSSSGKSLNSDQNVEIQDQRWQDSAELDIHSTLELSSNQYSSSKPESRVRARLEQETRLNQNIWLLTVSNDAEAQKFLPESS